MTKLSNAARNAPATPNLRERAERLRDAAGRFIRHTDPQPQSDTSAAIQGPPPNGTVPAPIDAHPDTYALAVDDNGAGRRCPPGSAVIVEPVSPSGAGLVVLYRKGGGAEIWDITHNFVPGMFDVGEGSTVTPLVEMIAPESGRRGHLDAGQFEKAHRVIGVYVPTEVMQRHRPLPSELPIMTACPDGMVTHYADCAAAYPLVRHGETVVVDPSKRELVDGLLCLLEWNSGRRSILLTHHRAFGTSYPPAWWVDPVNRPSSREAMERRQRSGGGMFVSDGPYDDDRLREKIVGTVVGVLVPGPSQRAAPPMPISSELLNGASQTEGGQ